MAGWVVVANHGIALPLGFMDDAFVRSPTMAALPPAVFLTAEWRHLVMLNYEVDPRVLAARVPFGTELDAWQGRTLVSIIAFRFLNTRVRGWAIPWHRDFEEINLRFYVRRRAPEGWRRGVVFIKEIGPRWAIAAVARWVYHENYVALPTRSRIRDDERKPAMEFGWRVDGRWNGVRFRGAGPAALVTAGSLEEFITEHYWGYAAQPDGGCVEYQVEHPSWRVWQAAEATLDCDAGQLYGAEFRAPLAARPASAFLADGSPVIVRAGRRL